MQHIPACPTRQRDQPRHDRAAEDDQPAVERARDDRPHRPRAVPPPLRPPDGLGGASSTKVRSLHGDALFQEIHELVQEAAARARGRRSCEDHRGRRRGYRTASPSSSGTLRSKPLPEAIHLDQADLRRADEGDGQPDPAEREGHDEEDG